MLLILFPGYNDEKATWKSYFISKLKKNRRCLLSTGH